MKRLFGVMILAGLPVACGSTLPSAPGAVQNETAGSDATVASLARGKRPGPQPVCSATGEREFAIEAIQLSVLSSARGSVTVRADAVSTKGDRVSPCFAPMWSMSSPIRGAILIADNDPQVVTLSGSRGNYVVTATLKLDNGTYLQASTKVTIG